MVFLMCSHIFLNFVSIITFKPDSTKYLSLRSQIAFITAYKPNHSERKEDLQELKIYKYMGRVRVMIALSVLNIFGLGPILFELLVKEGTHQFSSVQFSQSVMSNSL